MVITSEYTLEPKPDTEFFYVRSRAVCGCPFCDGKLKPIGSRERKLRRMDGETTVLIIRRLRCLNCLHIHHEFPDIVVPYKRYDAETIERIVVSVADANSEKTMSVMAESETTDSVSSKADIRKTEYLQINTCSSKFDFPCELSTALRLINWFLELLASLKILEKSKQAEIMRLLQIETISLNSLKNLASGWMKHFIRAVIDTEYTRIA